MTNRNPFPFCLQALVQSMDEQQVRSALLALLKRGQASIDIIQRLSARAGSSAASTPVSAKPSWCHCGCCKQEKREKERVCCQHKPCIATSEFSAVCLNKYVLEAVARRHIDWLADDQPVIIPNNLLRKACYRQYIAWRYNYLGARNRRVSPSCVVWRVRENFPSSNGGYMGYMSD